MCRAVGESGRRCPCDTSEARRLRRHNAQARASHEIQSPVMVPELDVAETELYEQGFKEPDYSVGGEKIQEVHDAVAQIASLREAILSPLERTKLTYKKLILPTGEQVEINEHGVSISNSDGEFIEGGTPNLLIPYVEKATIHLGDKIHEIVEARSGIRDEEVLEDELAALAPTEAELEEKTAEAKAAWEELYETYGGQNEFYAVFHNRQDEEAYNKAREGWNRARELDQEKYEVARRLAQLASQGSKDANEKMAKQRETLIETLKEIRSLGGEVAVADNSHKKVLAGFQEAVSLYPSTWIEASNKRTPPRIKFTKSRAHYTDVAWQNQAKVVPRRMATLKPEGWEPDPNNSRELGEWIRMDEHGSWTDPDTGMRYEHYLEPGKVAWMQPHIEYARNYGRSNPEEKPKGRGWQRAEVAERKYDHELGKMYDTGNKEVVWYRQSTRRMSISSEAQPELTVSGEDAAAQKRVALHEFAHRVEASGPNGLYLKSMEEAFLKRRTTDPTTGERETLQTIYKGTKERGRPDNFVNLYMGKEYSDGSREVLSTGAEAVFHGSFGSLVGLGRQKADPEMKKFIIGLWASA